VSSILGHPTYQIYQITSTQQGKLETELPTEAIAEVSGLPPRGTPNKKHDNSAISRRTRKKPCREPGAASSRQRRAHLRKGLGQHVARLTARINRMSDAASCRQPRCPRLSFPGLLPRQTPQRHTCSKHSIAVSGNRRLHVGLMMPGKTSRCCRRARASNVQNHERNTKLHLARGRDKQNPPRLQARFARVNPASVALPDVDTEKLGCAKPALSGALASWLQHVEASSSIMQHHPANVH